jgi:hypothetical protein
MKGITPPRPRPLGRGRLHAAVLATAAALALASAAAPADASIGISSFSLTPSTTQAGLVSQSAGPNLNIVANFSTPNSDTPNTATLALAPGLLADPLTPSQCSGWRFTLNLCPASSWIGTGYVTGTVPTFLGLGISSPLSANLYLVQPGGSNIAEVGLIINVLGVPLESALAPVSVRGTPGNVGLDINFAGLPNNWNGINVVLNSLHLEIFGSVDGKPFTRNPTSCQQAVSTLSAVSYGSPGQTASASSTFTPTGCGAVAYSPKLYATATLDPSDSGVAYSTTITQSPYEAGTQSLSITTPQSLSPSLKEAAAACTLSVLAQCPAIGTATATTPLLPQPLSGNVVLVSHPGGLPTLAILFSSPISLTLTGTETLGGSPLALTTTFSAIPDIPLTNLSVTFDGGPDSLFLAQAQSLCTPPQTTVGVFDGANGATVTDSVATTVDGCPG